MYLIIIFSPFLGFLSASLFGRLIGPKGSALLTCSCLLISLYYSFISIVDVGLFGNTVYIELGSWIESGFLQVNWGFLFDSLTVVMCVIVSFVSFLVHLYSIEYMSHDPHLPRFMSYLSLFTFFMMILITADNFIQMFLGWEGVGLCSYLLINFWFTRVQANKAAIKAMIVNRVGDFFLVLGIILIFVKYKSLDYVTVRALTPVIQFEQVIFFNYSFNSIEIICFFLFLGAMGKSAQLGLHTWLPDAMEGPTPVSALIHAATMVTAGIFLIARCSFLYEHTTSILNLVTFVGASTAFFASSVGLLQNDLKRIIAYSTCSQLGYMVLACGSSDYSAGIFHLYNHAFFKALLFLGAGSVIHAVDDEQDIRKMGGLKKMVPFTYFVMITGSMALAGFPFLSGFYSKDLVLELAYGNFTLPSHYGYWMGSLGAFLTAFYSTRLVCLTFLSKPNGFKEVICSSTETFYTMSLALGVLLIPSIFIGYCSKEMFVGVGSDFFSKAIYFNPQKYHQPDSEFINYFYKALPFYFSFWGFVCSILCYGLNKHKVFQLKFSCRGRKIYSFLHKKWFFDKIYNEWVTQFFFKWGYSVSYKKIDRGLLEMLGPQGLSSVLLKTSYKVTKKQSFSLYHYSLLMITVMAAILLFNFLIANPFTEYRLLFICLFFYLLAP